MSTLATKRNPDCKVCGEEMPFYQKGYRKVCGTCEEEKSCDKCGIPFGQANGTPMVQWCGQDKMVLCAHCGVLVSEVRCEWSTTAEVAFIR